MLFPIEVGLPRKVIYNLQEYLRFINLYNGIKKATYKSVYSFDIVNEKPDYNSIIIDKIFFDFDGDNSWQEANRLHEELKRENIKHTLAFSGRGYHIFILTKSYKAKNPKSCIYNTQMFYINKLNLGCDKQIVGDIARLHRILNTYNQRGKRFCIPLTEEQFNMGDENIKQLATKQNFVKNVVEGNLLSLENYDCENKKEEFLIKIETTSSNDLLEFQYLPNCIQRLLEKKDMNYKERYLIILYFKEKGNTAKEVYEILKKHLSEKKFRHCIVEERQLQYLFERDDLMFPSCEKLKNDGICTGKCAFLNNVIYKNIYQNIYKGENI